MRRPFRHIGGNGMYLREFSFPDRDQEFTFFLNLKLNCYTDFYPFQVLSAAGLEKLVFEPVTILCGGNGCGKTTALNVIAETLEAHRDSPYNRSSFFPDYVRLCEAVRGEDAYRECRIITSDDVFDYMMDLRCINQGIDAEREKRFEQYRELKYSHFQLKSLDDYERLKAGNLAKRRTISRFTRESLMDNAVERSNGESAFLYFTEKIKDNGLYILDEPENSLSPERQQELVRFIEDSARFFGCQFIISTHSPFVLALRGAKIYDMNENPPQVKNWTALGHVQAYFRFFREHEKELETAAEAAGSERTEGKTGEKP